MNPAVIRLLQHIESYGLHTCEGCWSVYTGLPWYKRLVNWVCSLIGAPYTDPNNFSRTILLPLTQEEREAVNNFLQLNAPEPKCRTCGGTDLQADPAGYYCDAEDYRGAPLLCTVCTK